MMDATHEMLLNEALRLENIEYKTQIYRSLRFAFKRLYELADTPEEHILVLDMMLSLDRLEEINNDC